MIGYRREVRASPPPLGRAIAFETNRFANSKLAVITSRRHRGFLPLKGGGKEGVGPASTNSQNLGHRMSQTSIRWTNLPTREVAPTPSSPPPFRGRNPVWRPRVLLPPDSVRDDLFSYAIALPLTKGRGVAFFVRR